MFETEDALKYKHKLKTILIDTDKKVHEVGIKAWNGFAITGIRLTDIHGKHIIELNCTGQGIWLKHKMEEGQEIIGLQCNTKGVSNAISGIKLTTWVPRHIDLSQARDFW